VNFSVMGFVISVLEKRFEDEGDKRLAYEGDLGPDIWIEWGAIARPPPVCQVNGFELAVYLALGMIGQHGALSPIKLLRW